MDDHPATKQIYELIGRIATAWNVVEDFWYLIFTCLMRDTPREQVDVVYFQWETGAQQRQLIQAMADVVYPPDKNGRPQPMRKRLGQLHATTNDLAGQRNSVVHAVLALPISGAALAYGDDDFRVLRGNPRKPNKLAGKKVLRELTQTLKGIEVLVKDLEAVRDELAPKFPLAPEMIEALRKSGFPVPPWIVELEDPQADPQPK